MLGILEDPGEWWETLRAAKECIVKLPRSRGGVVSREMLEHMEESHVARLAVDSSQYSSLSQMTGTLLRRLCNTWAKG